MLDALFWFLAIQAIGLAAFPIAFHALPALRDRGYAFSKPLGLLVLGYAIWLLSGFHLLPNTRTSLVVLLIFLAAASVTYMMVRRRQVAAFLKQEWPTILAAEAIFLAFYVGWLIYRAYDPSVDTTEKPMDLLFLNASLQTRFAPPEDPWLRGHPVSYYYFGHWMMGLVAKLTGVPSNVSYNIALALVPAMAATAIFGLVYNAVRSHSSRWRTGAIFGLVGVLFLLMIGNLEGLLELLRVNGVGSQGFWHWVGIKGLDGPLPGHSWRPDEFWWWWRATRVIDTLGPGGASLDYTIQEFPFFSFLLGDLHPHAMSLPFILLFMAFCLNLLSSPDEATPGWLIRKPISAIMMSLSLGALALINTWDLATFAFLFGVLLFLRAYSRSGGILGRLFVRTVPVALLVIALAVILYLPFYRTLSTQASGILPVNGPITRPLHLVLVWGLFLVAVVPFLAVLLWRSRPEAGWLKRALVALAIPAFPFLVWAFLHMEFGGGQSVDLAKRFFQTLPLLVLVSASIYITLSQARSAFSSGRIFGLAALSLAFLLLLGPELLFVADFFGNRMNTVFKLYYQAWVLFAVAAPLGLYYWTSKAVGASGWKRWLFYSWVALFLLLLAGSLYYPITALDSKSGGLGGKPTLDGLAYLKRSQPAEYEAIVWLRANVVPEEGILEAVGSDVAPDGKRKPGGDYNPTFGRISSSTGIPTVLGWYGHEHQWRGGTLPMDGRWEDVVLIYQTRDPAEAKRLLEKYRIQYVYVGPRERREYGEDGLEKFETFMDKVFYRDDVAIYRLRQ